MKEELNRLNCFVENKPGVLARIVGLISGRGYNIQTLSVGPTEDGTVSRMKIDVWGDDRVIEQVMPGRGAVPASSLRSGAIGWEGGSGGRGAMSMTAAPRAGVSRP